MLLTFAQYGHDEHDSPVFFVAARGADKGTFSRIDTPQAERQLLEWLAKELGASSWAATVNARLAEGTN